MKFILVRCSYLVAFFAFMITSGCSDPTTIGSDLLEEDLAQLEVIDTLTIEAYTIPGERVRTYSPFTALESYMVNNLQDPVFGSTEAITYFQTRLEFTNPLFTNAIPDSLVLVLGYDTSAFYGDLTQPFTMDVLRLQEEIDQNDDFYSDTSAFFREPPVGSITFTPNDLDTVTFINYLDGTPDTSRETVMRIPLDLQLADELINLDTTAYDNDTSFLNFFNGLVLRAAGPTANTIGFDLFDNRGGMYMYYRRDTLFREFRYTFGNFSTKFVGFEHDYTGTPIEEALASTEPSNDSILYTQAMQGPNIAFRFPTIRNLQNVVVNKAELIIHSSVLGIDDPANFPAADQLVFYSRNDDGELAVIRDFQLATDNIGERFGGQPEADPDGHGVTYRFSISAHLQDVISGRASEEIYLSAFPRPERATRVVLVNPPSGPEKIQLNLTVTRLN